MHNEIKIPRLRYIKLKEPTIEHNYEEGIFTSRFDSALLARVCDYTDNVICDAIIQYATERGYTDLYLIDEEFIKSAIINEIKRRKNFEEDEELVKLHDTISEYYRKHGRRANDEQR